MRLQEKFTQYRKQVALFEAAKESFILKKLKKVLNTDEFDPNSVNYDFDTKETTVKLHKPLSDEKRQELENEFNSTIEGTINLVIKKHQPLEEAIEYGISYVDRQNRIRKRWFGTGPTAKKKVERWAQRNAKKYVTNTKGNMGIQMVSRKVMEKDDYINDDKLRLTKFLERALEAEQKGKKFAVNEYLNEATKICKKYGYNSWQDIARRT